MYYKYKLYSVPRKEQIKEKNYIQYRDVKFCTNLKTLDNYINNILWCR